MTKLQKRFFKWFRKQKARGLKTLVFSGPETDFIALKKNSTNLPPDDIIRESFAIDRAIHEGRHSPLPANF